MPLNLHSYIYMQNFNEISQLSSVYSIIYYILNKKLKLNIILLYIGVYGHLKIIHTVNTRYICMPNLNLIHHVIFEIISLLLVGV